MKKYLELNYKEECKKEIKETLENKSGCLIIFVAPDRTKSSKVSIVLETSLKCKWQLFNGKISNYNLKLNIQDFLIKEYSLQGFSLQDYNYYLYEV